MKGHHEHTLQPVKATFPVIRRFRTATHPDVPCTNVSYYNIRADRLPKKGGMINLCMISDDNDVFLKLFEAHSGMNGFVAPSMKEVSMILLAPTEKGWKVDYLDVDVYSRNEKNEMDVRTQRFVPYYGDIETDCAFVPMRGVNEDQKKKWIDEYTKQKRDTNLYTIGFLLGGTGLFQATSGTHNAMVFVFGCTIGIVYQLLLQHEVDDLGKDRMFIKSAVRLAALTVIISVVMKSSEGLLPSDLWIGYSGFLTQKLALWIAFL